ncbi:thioesterase II family protein [Streptomyces canus]|uniref:thioesterase II family protein n=1 Tax=Streptomyces canus TaxID=58343 RepID=UPI00386F0B1F|nr:alpha/beta fold hydrolase [Streptomyces canus]
MTRWTVRRHRRPDAAVVLYCFPHAGGLPGEYVRWSDDLPGVEVRGVHLPGRTTRRAEPPYTRMDALVNALVSAVDFESPDSDGNIGKAEHSRRPFVFFGHSLGALVAFEVARELRARRRALPQRLIVSSCPAPPLPPVVRPVRGLSDDRLLDAIERGTGEPMTHLREDADLREHALASFRADYALLEQYAPGPAEPLDCPITVLAGSEEPWSPWRDGWAGYTSAATELRVAAGGHFYFREGPGRDDHRHALRQSVPTTTTWGECGWTA